MIHKKSHFLKYCQKKIGPGGFKCMCCWTKDKNAKKPLFRSLKRSYRNLMKQYINKELDE